LGGVDGLPGAGKALVEGEFLPHLIALFAAKGPSLDEPVDAPVREAVSISFVVEARAISETQTSHGAATDVCSRSTSASRSKSCAMGETGKRGHVSRRDSCLDRGQTEPKCSFKIWREPNSAAFKPRPRVSHCIHLFPLLSHHLHTHFLNLQPAGVTSLLFGTELAVSLPCAPMLTSTCTVFLAVDQIGPPTYSSLLASYPPSSITQTLSVAMELAIRVALIRIRLLHRFPSLTPTSMWFLLLAVYQMSSPSDSYLRTYPHRCS
jgi:hypothetical protein